MRRSDAARENADRTARALKVVYTVVLPQMSRAGAIGAPGYSGPSYSRLVLQNPLYFRQLAEELGGSWMELMRSAAHEPAEYRRIVREHMEDRAAELALYVSGMRAPLRKVVQLRSCGLSWRSVLRHPDMEGRVHYSVMDDWAAALGMIWRDRGDCVRAIL